jgi:CHRD domain
MIRFTRTALAASVLGFALGVAPACADMLKYKADLTGPGESPPTDSKGTGSVEATYDTATKTLTWSGAYADLTGPETAAHFHGPAAMGANAPPMVPVEAPASPFKGSAVLTDAQAKAFADGKIYFNIHTAKNKGGEIRGQLAPVM